MRVKIFVSLKKGVLDPQGKAVLGALDTLGFREIKDLRMGKFMEIELEAATKDEAKKRVKEMCEKLLANIVMEDFKVEVEG